MKYYIIIPVHNEEAFLAKALDAIAEQTLPPARVVLVNDNSTDNSGAIIDRYVAQHPNFIKVTTSSSDLRLPGSKVINAFNKGLGELDDAFDFIVKLDADLILPESYFERIAQIFTSFPMVGIAGGFFHEKDSDGQWKLYHPMDRNHVRGAFKSYTKQCFNAIGGLKNAMGWDTVDELLAQFHGFELFTDESLAVKNLRPVGSAYSKEAKFLQGQAMYKMRYGLCITLIASLKMAVKKREAAVFSDNMKGYLKSKNDRLPYLVTEEQGKFIRRLRWRNIRKKLF